MARRASKTEGRITAMDDSEKARMTGRLLSIVPVVMSFVIAGRTSGMTSVDTSSSTTSTMVKPMKIPSAIRPVTIGFHQR